MNARIDAWHEIVYPNTLQPANLHFGRCKQISIPMSETKLPRVRESTFEGDEGLAENWPRLGSTVHTPIPRPHEFIEDKKFNPAGTLLRQIHVP